MINWKELNYAKGLERIYDVIWGTQVILAILIFIVTLIRWGGISREDLLSCVGVIVVPYFIKKVLKILLPWIWRGFTEK